MDTDLERQNEQRKQEKLGSLLQAAQSAFKVAYEYQREVINENTHEAITKAQGAVKEAIRSAAKIAKELGREVRL
ncbi:MAG: hypothetical protein IPP97_27395 [Candidatus Obscuribacter sp.]|nr:hypothetical protein [Candidatus Obscuribacter sp.]